MDDKPILSEAGPLNAPECERRAATRPDLFNVIAQVRGDGRQRATHCPVHGDTRASLSVGRGDDGRVLLHCHAGCSVDAIVGAVGLTVRDLMPAEDGRRGERRIVATYHYEDERGAHLFDVVRFLPKDFRQRRGDGTWSMDGVRRVIYKLPQLRGHQFIFVVEGEKDVEALTALGVTATCNPGGAGKWRDEYTRQIVDAGTKRVCILPDNDEPGRAHADAVARACQAARLEVRVLDLPGLPPKGDVSDWLKAHHTCEDLTALVDACPIWNVQTSDHDPSPTVPSAEHGADDTLSWPDPIDLAVLLETIQAFIRSYVVLTAEQATLVALWAAQTHMLDAFDYVMYLHITSPMPECGKTRLLEVLEALVPRPWLTGRVTAAVLMRKVDAEKPVVLLDESDAAFNAEQDYAEALRGLLNTGFARTGRASTCVGQGARLSYRDFQTFCPKAIAGIGRLPSTVESRSVPITLKRRTKDEQVRKWRRREAWAESEPLRRQLATVGRQCVDALRAARPTMPEGLSDRAEDVLEPVFAIADLAGGPWPQRTRQAAVMLMGFDAREGQEREQAIGLELLEDVRHVFLAKNWPARLQSSELISGLISIDESPWSTFTKGEKPITPHRLARMLRGFGIESPRKLREGAGTIRGYRLEVFEDAFARYLPSKVEQAEQPKRFGPGLATAGVERGPAVPPRRSAVSPVDPDAVPHVPHSEGEGGAKSTDGSMSTRGPHVRV